MHDILLEMEEDLKARFSDVYSSLNPGATENDLALLKKCFDSGHLPSDLEILYRWHNGQSGSFSLSQEDNRTLLPIEEVVESWEFLNDPMEDISGPISKSWIPILSNGAGDYLMYESQEPDQGKLIAFWHDDEKREVEFDSLERWAEAVKNSNEA